MAEHEHAYVDGTCLYRGCDERLAEWERDLLAAEQSGRPEPVDPADVRVGDVVEVEADDGSWMVRGEVGDVDPDSVALAVRLSIGTTIMYPHRDPGATVRRLRRAEPQPDPEQVEAVAQLLYEAKRHWRRTPHLLPVAVFAKHLVRRGVRVDYRLRDDVRRHLDRLEAAVGDPHGLDVGAIADAVAGLRRAVDGGPDDA